MDGRWIQTLVKAAAIVVVVLVAYAPAFRADFIWDDNYLVWDNPLNRSFTGLRKYWLSAATPDYWPLTSTLIWMDWQMWGNRPAGYHVQTIMFHAGNAVLLWLLLRHLRVKGAWWAGLLWAAHPVNAATVAWISELKNTFSTLFVVPAMLAYLKFDESGRRRLYWLSFGLFLLGMLAKTSVVGIPLVMLLCVWWRRKRLSSLDILRIVPFVLAAIVLGAVTIWFHMFNPYRDNSLIVPAGNIAARLAAAGWAIWFYIGKTLLPIRLIMVYPRWQIDPSNPLVYLPLLAVLGGLALCWRYRATWGRHALLAAGSFLLLIVPALGFVNMSYMMHTLVSDHFQYLPMAATIAGVVAAVSFLARGYQRQLFMVAAAVIAGLTYATASRAWTMRGHESLWRNTIAQNPGAWIAYYHLGTELAGQGIRFQEAGRAREAMSLYAEAVDWLQRGTRLRPEYADMFHNLATVLDRMDRTEEAIVVYRQALAKEEQNITTHYNLGLALRRKGRAEEAKIHFLRALDLSNWEHMPSLEALAQMCPNEAPVCNNYGFSLEKAGRLREALAQYQKALALQPNSAVISNNLARVERTLAAAGATGRR